jgi:hypothetical protein
MERYTLQEIGVAHLSSGWDSVEPVANRMMETAAAGHTEGNNIQLYHLLSFYDLSAVDFTLKDDIHLLKSHDITLQF